jgi:hypothetical protein
VVAAVFQEALGSPRQWWWLWLASAFRWATPRGGNLRLGVVVAAYGHPPASCCWGSRCSLSLPLLPKFLNQQCQPHIQNGEDHNNGSDGPLRQASNGAGDSAQNSAAILCSMLIPRPSPRELAAAAGWAPKAAPGTRSPWAWRQVGGTRSQVSPVRHFCILGPGYLWPGTWPRSLWPRTSSLSWSLARTLAQSLSCPHPTGPAYSCQQNDF